MSMNAATEKIADTERLRLKNGPKSFGFVGGSARS